jgi:hypothetical protein
VERLRSEHDAAGGVRLLPRAARAGALPRTNSQLERDTTPLERVQPPFPRLEYTDAVTILQEKGQEIQWGEDLGAPDETILGDMHDRPVFIMNYPKEAKAFYMKENPADPRTVLCDDLIAPEGYGEIIGGSQREDDHDRLLARIREEGLPEDAYKWYLELRKYGTFPHSRLRPGPRAHRRLDHGPAAHPRDDRVPEHAESDLSVIFEGGVLNCGGLNCGVMTADV